MMQEQATSTHRRKNVYIDKDFQARFILKFCALVAAGAALTIGFLYFLSMQSTTVSFVQAKVKVMTTADFLLPVLVQTVLVVMGFVSLASIAVTLIVSHKIAGPLFRFKQTLKELSDGNFSNQVRLRKGDQLLEVAGDFNQMITLVRARLVDAKKALALVQSDIDAIGEFNVEDGKRKMFHDLQQKVRDLEKALEFFKV
jgi:nitrogen fixation/metabolism regulation signal transduction histidine kinase